MQLIATELRPGLIARLQALVVTDGSMIFHDLDGVHAGFDQAFPAVFGLDHRSLADDEMWSRINNHPTFFIDLPQTIGSKAFFDAVSHIEHAILTACSMTKYEDVARQKRGWVRRDLSPNCLILPVRGSHTKPLFMRNPGDILIDDYGKNCRAWEAAGGRAIKHKVDFNHTAEQLLEMLGG